MLIDDYMGGDAANPLQPDVFEVVMMLLLAGALFFLLPIVLLVLAVVLLVRWIRTSSVAAAESGALGVEMSRRVDSIDRRLGNIEKTLNEAGS